MEFKNEAELRNLSMNELRDYFVQVQRFIATNLTRTQRKEYRKDVRDIPSDTRNGLIRKIKASKCYRDSAIRNQTIKKRLRWVHKYFPEEITLIKEELDQAFEEDKLYVLEARISELEDMLPTKQRNQVIQLKKRLKKIMVEEKYESFLREIRKTKDIDEKIRLLTQKLNRTKRKLELKASS